MVGPEMVGRNKGALKQEQYDADFVMLGKTAYLQEPKDSAMTEYCSSLTLSELEGCSRYSVDAQRICHVNYPLEVERCEIVEDSALSSLEHTQNADNILDSTADEVANGPIIPVLSDPAKKSVGWRKVRKIFPILRFVKGLERLKKFNPKLPQYMPIENNPQEEVVHLRHQKLEERKNREEWMLDHALKEVVSKLEPARRRKMQLLVDAFETVHPLAKQDSVQVEAHETVPPLVNQESDESRRNHTFRTLCAKRNLEWTLAAINIILEALAAAFDQAASPNKPKYALIGLLMSVIAVCLCMGEFIYKAREARVVFRRRGLVWWLSTPFPDYRPFGTFSDIFGFICAAFQCIFSLIQYAYFSHHAENPLKISLLPLIFALCVAYSRYSSRDREPLPHRHNP